MKSTVTYSLSTIAGLKVEIEKQIEVIDAALIGNAQTEDVEDE